MQPHPDGPVTSLVAVGRDVWALLRTSPVHLTLSSDGGDHWSPASGDPGLVTVSGGLARVGLTSAYIVGGTQSGIANVIAVTSDRGRSWLQMPSPCHASMTRIVPLGGGNMWLFCSGPGATIMADKQISRSHSGGSAWTLVADTGTYQSRPRIGDLSLIGHLADVAVIDDQHAWIALSRDRSRNH